MPRGRCGAGIVDGHIRLFCDKASEKDAAEVRGVPRHPSCDQRVRTAPDLEPALVQAGRPQSRTILGTAGVLMLLPGWPVLVNRRSVTSDVTEAPADRASSGSSLATG